MAAELETFSIRSHHLHHLHLIMNGYYSPEWITNTFTERMKELRERQNIDNSYAFDTIGPDEQSADSFRGKETAFFRKFLALSDDNPVEVSPAKDGICASCHFGKHCESDYMENGKDLDYFGHFLRTGRALELQDSYTFTTKPQMKITTTAGTAKHILKQTNFEHPEYTSTLARRMLDSNTAKKSIETAQHLKSPLQRIRPLIAAVALVAASASVYSTVEAIASTATTQEHFDTSPYDLLVAGMSGLAVIAIPRRKSS